MSSVSGLQRVPHTPLHLGTPQRQRVADDARVLEIPTPTWLAYDRAFCDIELPDDAVLVHQERAYTSPIW